MKVASVCVALAALLGVVLATAVRDSPRVTTTLGVVVGTSDDKMAVNAWLGVPYAASTEGANRFQPPKAREPWKVERDATKLGPGCYQYKKNADAPDVQSEDCLHANIYAPKLAGNLPVVVWIHGGGFMEGSNIGPYQVYSGSYFAAKARAVVIAINYRLGSLGFLVSGTGAADIAGNMGFMDQQFALNWVKANAAAFGGNPKQVTLWGESAGAMSIGLHMISPDSKGLFHRVIMESNPLAIVFKEQKDAVVLGQDTCHRAGCDGCGLSCMQAVPVDKLMAASKDAAGSLWNGIAANYKHILGALLDFTPVVTGKTAAGKDTIIPSQVIPALVSGKFEKVPMITGTNLQEGQTFVYEALTEPVPMFAAKAGLIAVWPFHAEEMLGRYTTKADTDGREPLSRVVTDYLFTCPSQQFAVAGALANTRVNSWVYQYQHVFSISALFKGLIPDRCATAVCHAVELPLVFHNGPIINGKEQPLSDTEKALSDQIIDYFGNFIRTGNPNVLGVTTKQWPVFSPGARNALVLGGPASGTTVFFDQTCKRWDQLKYGAGPLVRFRAVHAEVEAVDEEDEMDAADEVEVEDEMEDEAEDEDESESDAELDAEDAAEMEDFAEDEAEAERYEFADA